MHCIIDVVRMIFSPFNYMGGKRRLLPVILGKCVDNWNIGNKFLKYTRRI